MQSDESPSSPRAFAQASGMILQMVGAILALGSCCWWSFTGLTQARLPVTSTQRSIRDVVQSAGPGQIWAMASVCASFSGGLALAALGLGLQAERRRSGAAAAMVSAAGTLFWIAYLMGTLIADPAFSRIILGILMVVVWGMCLVLAAVSADELRRFPPPPDLGRAPPDLKVDRMIDREMPNDLRE